MTFKCLEPGHCPSQQPQQQQRPFTGGTEECHRHLKLSLSLSHSMARSNIDKSYTMPCQLTTETNVSETLKSLSLSFCIRLPVRLPPSNRLSRFLLPFLLTCSFLPASVEKRSVPLKTVFNCSTSSLAGRHHSRVGIKSIREQI